jgi:hypothetical protein
MCHKQLGVERTSLPYGFFDCWTRSGGGENALINYGILQTLFQGQRAVQSIQLSYLFCIHKVRQGVYEKVSFTAENRNCNV